MVSRFTSSPCAAVRLPAICMGMTISEKQASLIKRYSIIEDAQERLAAIVARGRKWPGVTDDERDEVHRVKGCVSQVWLAGGMDGGGPDRSP